MVPKWEGRAFIAHKEDGTVTQSPGAGGSGAHLHLYHLHPGTEVQVLVNEDQTERGPWLLRHHEELSGVLRNSDLDDALGLEAGLLAL